MIIPVFDIKNNMCVCGKSGERESYSELHSVYGENIDEIIGNLKKSGASVVYIADLDKIEGKGDNSELISEINERIPVLLDNGSSSIEDIECCKNICTYPILATETMSDLSEINRIFEEINYNNIIISIDIKNDEVLVKNDDIDLEDIISLINNAKPDYTILLNISQVGTEKGNRNNIIRKLIDKTPYTQHIIAGGITNQSIEEFKKEGIDNFLIGTILHEGKLSPKYLWWNYEK